jgi:uncharacterized protein involved in response to NO
LKRQLEKLYREPNRSPDRASRERLLLILHVGYLFVPLGSS